MTITDDTFHVDPSLSHIEKVEEYRKAFNTLLETEKKLKENRQEAKDARQPDAYFEADVELDRISKYWVPFTTASVQAEQLIEDGHKINDSDGNLAPPKEGYKPDPIITLLMIIAEAVTQEFLDSLQRTLAELQEGEPDINDYIEAFVQLTPGLRILQDFRDQLIPRDDNGEIAKIIRDPVKRPIEIIQNIRDEIIDPDDSGEIAKIIRDPIKTPAKAVEKTIRRIFKW